MLTGYLSLGCRTGGDWANTRRWTKRLTVFFFKQEVAEPQILPYFLPYRIPLGGLYFKYNNYIMHSLYNIIIICINNNAVINNYGRHQGLIFLFNIPMSTQKNFFEVNEPFGHATSKFQQLWLIRTLSLTPNLIPIFISFDTKPIVKSKLKSLGIT